MPEENYNGLVGAILEGNEKYEGKDIDEYIESKVPTSEIRGLFNKILEGILDASSENNNVLHNIRCSLGPAYGTNCIANLGFDSVHKYYQKHGSYSFEELGQTNFIRKIQVVAAEALHWWEKVYFVAIAVILPGHYEKHHKQYYDCFAFQCPNNKNGGAKWEKENLDEVCQKYNDEMEKYLEKGSSAMHSSHLKMDEGGAANRSRYRRKPFTPKAVYIGEVKSKAMENEREDAGSTTTTDSPYVTNVIMPTYKTLSSKGRKGNSANTHEFHEFHLSQGSETNFMNDAENISTIAHMYIIAKKRVKKKVLLLPPAYRHAMNALLQHLSVESVCEVLRERQKTLEKHAQMLNLLQAPLHRLTKALRDTDESAQRLRAVLYDPSSSIFAAAHGVHRYFEKNRRVQVVGFSWSALHEWREPPPGKEKEDNQQLGLTVLAIIAHIFGIKFNEERGSDEGGTPTAALKLWEEVNDRLVGSEPAEEDLRTICKQLLFTPFSANDSPSQDEGQLWCGLRDQVVGIPCSKEEKREAIRTHWISVVSMRFKKLLLEPYKFDSRTASILPLALILYERNAKCELCLVKGDEKTSFENFEKVLEQQQEIDEGSRLFSKCRVPYARAIVLWTLILRLAALEKPVKATCTTHEAGECLSTEIEIDFKGNVFAFEGNRFDDEFMAFMKRLEPLITLEKEGGYAPGGDSTLPWFDFALSCKADKRQGEAPQNGDKIFYSSSHEISIEEDAQKNGGIALKINRDGTEFSILCSTTQEKNTITITTICFKASSTKKNENGGVV